MPSLLARPLARVLARVSLCAAAVLCAVAASPALAQSVETDWPDMTWDQVLAEARGQQVNLWHWGGDSRWNAYFDQILGDAVQADGVTVQSVLIDDTAQAVNKVLAEIEAGKTSGGAVDLIWINGENFVTLRQANLLFGPYTDTLPNAANMDPASAALAFDFGFPVAGFESPQGASQFTLTYNSAMVPQPPTTVDGLLGWICENPGLFTYPAPPAFTGREFLLEVLYRVTGGADQWQGPWTADKQALWAEKAPLLWAALNRIEPCLWRGGATYPADKAPMDELYGNGELAWTFSAGSGQSAASVRAGQFADTSITMIFADGTHASTHYLAIPVNAAHKAAALVVANAVLSCAVQLAKAQPESIGDLPAIDIRTCPAEVQAGFAAIDYGAGGISPAQLAAAPILPMGGPDLARALEDGWRAEVLEK